jgi:hypothetical protein
MAASSRCHGCVLPHLLLLLAFVAASGAAGPAAARGEGSSSLVQLSMESLSPASTSCPAPQGELACLSGQLIGEPVPGSCMCFLSALMHGPCVLSFTRLLCLSDLYSVYIPLMNSVVGFVTSVAFCMPQIDSSDHPFSVGYFSCEVR